MYGEDHRMNTSATEGAPGAVSAAPAWRARVDRVLAWLCRGLMGIFFREVQVQGLEKVPRGVPLVLVANHHNSLIDPLLVLAHLDAHPRFLAKSTLWDIPVMRRLLDIGGVIPVYRKQDEGVDTTQNLQTFARCHEELARGGAVSLFPEGISHSAPHLAEVKTGAARIVLEAEQTHGPLGSFVVPVGLTFDEKGTFRSRALIRIGEPIAIEAWRERHAAAEGDVQRNVVRDLTSEIREGLAKVTLNYPSVEDVRAIERASEMIARDSHELPARMAMDEAFAMRQDFIEAGLALRQRFPERMDALRDRLSRYDDELQRLRLRDDQVAARYPHLETLAYVVGSASLLFFWLPLALVGTLIHFIPYRLCGVVARFMKTEDLPATMKLFTGFFLFPLTWLLLFAATWAATGPGWAFLVLGLAPLTGWFAMLFHERHEHFWNEVDSYLSLTLRPQAAARLRKERERLREELRALGRQRRP